MDDAHPGGSSDEAHSSFHTELLKRFQEGYEKYFAVLESLNFPTPTREEASEALSLAEEVYSEILKRLPNEIHP